MPEMNPNAKRYLYLLTEAYRARYAMASWFLRDSPAIVEIGGGEAPISEYVTGKRLFLVDPIYQDAWGVKIPVCKFGCKVSEFVKTAGVLLPERYGLLALGIGFHPDERTEEPAFLELMKKAGRVVIEYPPDYAPSLMTSKRILAESGRKEVAMLDLLVWGDPKKAEGDGLKAFPFRRMIVLE